MSAPSPIYLVDVCQKTDDEGLKVEVLIHVDVSCPKRLVVVKSEFHSNEAVKDGAFIALMEERTELFEGGHGQFSIQHVLFSVQFDYSGFYPRLVNQQSVFV